MIPLTDKGLEEMSETPFLRVDKDSYKALYIVLVFVLFMVLMAPVLGPRVKPAGWEQPKTLADYFSRLWPYAIILLVMTILPLTDLIIRWIEVKVGTKRAKRMVVKRKLTTKKWTLIIFEPFHISVFKYFFRLRMCQTW
jgi:hypothetical protein